MIVHTPEEFDSWLSSQLEEVASSQNLERAVAVSAANLSDGEFLAPYAAEMGIEKQTLEHLRPSHHAAHHAGN